MTDTLRKEFDAALERRRDAEHNTELARAAAMKTQAKLYSALSALSHAEAEQALRSTEAEQARRAWLAPHRAQPDNLTATEAAALEPATPATPAGYAYITHNGTGMPVPRDTIVEVISPSGLTETGPASRFNDAGRWFWIRCEADKPDGIKLYREVGVPASPDAGVEPAGEPEMPEGEPFPSIDDIQDPNFTGGLGTIEYLDRLHAGTLGERDANGKFSPEPASEQDAPEATDPQTDAGSAPEASGEAGCGMQPPSADEWRADRDADDRVKASYGMASANQFAPGFLNTHDSDCATHNAPAMAPGDCTCDPVAADPSLHPEHDGTGYWTGTVDGETP